ncbi:MAG: chitobiase/beta-hexosaminidase C-terminal domain-containing protein [Bacteroidales bacterium]|nr:chitobiase/beta-hexosaminidase C-terminal domain-containing protein [Bacteroidales bacterium]
MLRRGRGVRLMLLAALLLGGLSAQAQQYVFMRNNSTTYYYANGTTWSNSATFSPSYIWTVSGSVPSNNSRYLIISRSGNNTYTYTPSLSTTSSNTYTFSISDGNVLTTSQKARSNSWNNSTYYLPYGFGNLATNTAANDRVIAYQVNTSQNTLQDNTTLPTISIDSYSGNTITFSHDDLGGSYVPANSYTIYTINGAAHNWYNSQDWGTAVPTGVSVNANTLSPTYTWSLTADGGGVASINPSTGVLTISGAPTGNITVRLTVSNISPLSNKPVDFTLTHTHFNETSPTTATITGLTVSPSTATLEYDESQAFTASATVNATTTTTAAYERLTNGGNNYYYYDGALHAATPTPVEEVTHPTPTYSWALSGTAATYLSLSTASGATTTATHSTGAQSNSNATLTVTATTPDASNSTATATITVVPTTATAIAGDNQTIYVGNGGTVTYTLTPAHAYDRVSATSGNTGVFTVDASPVSGGSVAITPVAPGQTTLTLVALKPDGTNGPTTTVTITVRNLVATPEISFALDGSDVKATLTCATGGATIKYTTDGSDPATSGTAQTYSGTPFTVTNGTTVKAYATGSNEYWDASTTVTKVCTPLDYVEQGVSGNIATLNDLEDHTWSYYQASGNLPTGYPAELHSPDPRNVKITYKGNGQLTDGTAVTGVKVGVDADVHTFIYYKTLEKNSNDRYAYTTIPNPFSVRPTTGTGNSMVYYGFSHWKVISVSGGTIQGNPATINAETEIEFNVTSDYTTNCQSMEVVLEAVWDVAEVSTDGTFTKGYNSVERNFYVVSSTTNYSVPMVGTPCTYSSFYPNGTTDGTTPASLNNRATRRSSISATADSKIEYIILYNYNNYTINAQGHNFTIGRGVSGYNNNGCATNLYGLSANQSTGFRFRIESGSYGNLYFMGSETALTAGVMTATMGCDYDRANNEDNTKLSVTTDITVAYSATLGSSNNKGAEIFNCTVKSGNFDLGTSNYAGSNQFYLSNWGSNNYIYGKRKMTVEGGIFSDIAGGMDDDGTTTQTMVEIRIKGGTMNSVVYGAAQRSDAEGHRIMVITGGDFRGWIAGGANGNSNQSNSNGEMTGNTYIYVGGNASVNSNGSTSPLNRAVGGNVFGAGCGYGSGYSSGLVTGNTNVVIADNAYIERGVYGGGSYGYTTQTSNIYILGGHIGGVIGGVNGTSYSASITGGVFGGACQNQGGTVNIYMSGGLVEGGIYGGSNSSGTVTGPVTIKINGGQVGADAEHSANIHGGGYGSSTVVSGNVELTVGASPSATEYATIYGDVYGGSALGKVNGTSANTDYHTYVTLNKGVINGSLYGGALGAAGTAANVYAPVAVKVYGGTVTGAVYGCNNVNGAPQRAVTVDIYGTDPQPAENYAIANVYGGGNQANYTYATPPVVVHGCPADISIGAVYGGGNRAEVPSTNVTIWGGNRIGEVYIGGNNANVNGNAEGYIKGGTIGRVFAGNNHGGTISGSTVKVEIESAIEEGKEHCPMNIGAVFHGGNEAGSAQRTVNIICTGSASEGIDTLFGGANNAQISGDVVLSVGHGHIRQGIFGGNNSGGTVTGNISVTVTNDGTGCNFPYPTVFGGGYGAATTTGGNITINIGEKTATNTAPIVTATIEGGAVYGGSALGSVNGSSSNTTIVNINNGTFTGNIYGGGLGDAGDPSRGWVNGPVTVNIGASDQDDANCVIDLSTSSIYGCNNTNGSPQDDVAVNIYRTGHTPKNLSSYHDEADSTFAIDQVFGGGNLANYLPENGDENSLKKATVHVYTCANTINRLFGGGNAAAATGVVTIIEGGRFGYVFGGGNGERDPADIGKGGTNLTVRAGRIAHLFGASNTQGTIRGPMVVNLNYANEGQTGCEEVIGEFFGGGNLAVLGEEGNPVTLSTTIACGVGNINNIYGGSNLADIYGNVTLTLQGGTFVNVFGGSKGNAGTAATIHGAVTLNLNGGTMENAFGGCDVNGNITGKITVNVEETSLCPLAVDYVFGGGRDAAYTPTDPTLLSPEVNVKHIASSITYDVFGGGLGLPARVTANPVVNIGNGTAVQRAVIGRDVFGGGNAAPVTGNTLVNVTGNSVVTHNIYGGGNAASISADTEVRLTGHAKVWGNVYGGGNQGPVNGNTKVIVNGVVAP